MPKIVTLTFLSQDRRYRGSFINPNGAPGSTIPIANDEHMAFCARLAVGLGHMSLGEHSDAMREADHLMAVLCTDTTLETD